jgi:hypothetical protein
LDLDQRRRLRVKSTTPKSNPHAGRKSELLLTAFIAPMLHPPERGGVVSIASGKHPETSPAGTQAKPPGHSLADSQSRVHVPAQIPLRHSP